MTAKTITVPVALIEQIKDSHQANAALIESYQQDHEKRAASDEKVRALIPQVVEAMVRHGRIAPEERTKAAAALADPARALQIMLNIASPASGVEPPAVGGPRGVEKTAAAHDSQRSSFETNRREFSEDEEAKYDRILAGEEELT